uniref:uncharacterized protein C5orf49 homolog n=1 Tax=Ciona intestinalis TaxID=7719 RepID=UPI0002B8EC9D|nr:uncharacterized protein C5orf49 homolog [Ciona intestinalis]|eukprot:XP_004226028.1 uncharacterized protein C5orf49 homolog [Ciona intestinalis]
MEGGEHFTPEQRKLQWCEFVRRERKMCNTAFDAWEKPYGTWLQPNDIGKNISYFNNNKQHGKHSEYERLFHLKHHYEKKLHRDDRANRIGLNVHDEEKDKAVPILSSSVYGSRPPLEKTNREHVIIESVNKGFYRSRGTNIPSSSDG